MKKILIVEDDSTLRESLHLLLEDSNFEVTSIPDGKTALMELKHKDFDVAILDDNLPFIQGSDLFGLIKIKNPKIKIILMSGLFNNFSITEAKQNGVDLVIEKPFDFNVIIDFLNTK